jgi:hypothetical protein
VSQRGGCCCHVGPREGWQRCLCGAALWVLMRHMVGCACVHALICSWFTYMTSP